jgi:hypothetical protein
MAVGVPGKSEPLQRVGESGILRATGQPPAKTDGERRMRSTTQLHTNSTSVLRVGYQIIGVRILGLFIILLIVTSPEGYRTLFIVKPLKRYIQHYRHQQHENSK